MTETKTLRVFCKGCGQSVVVEYTPNPIIGDSFIKATCYCNACADKLNHEQPKTTRPATTRHPGHND